MNATVNVVRIIVFLLFAHSLCFAATQADERATSLEDELARQAEIYQSRGHDRPDGYVIDRSLLAYTITLPSEFIGTLADLAEADRWLDIGAGEGRAILDYCTGKYDGSYWRGEARPGRKARAVAMSIEDRRTQQWEQAVSGLAENQVRYLSGRRLSQYSNEELGTFRMITDVLGGFSYTDSLSRFTEKALALLEVNGSFYTVLQDVRAEQEANKPHYPGSPFLTEIVDADGSELRICSWLKRIGCVEVSCEFKNDFTPPVEVYRIRKTCNDVTVPPLATEHYQAGTPPERRFRVEKTVGRQALSNP